jgi:hypothetical protein
MIDNTLCPLPPVPPWHRRAENADAIVVLRIRRARLPDCKRLRDGGFCPTCLHDVMPWRLPEVRR